MVVIIMMEAHLMVMDAASWCTSRDKLTMTIPVDKCGASVVQMSPDGDDDHVEFVSSIDSNVDSATYFES